MRDLSSARCWITRKGGSFEFAPTGEFRIEREYLEDSAILQTRFITENATVKLTDFFVIARKSNARFYDFTSLHPTRKLVRLAELERGSETEIEIRVSARPDYARALPTWRAERGRQLRQQRGGALHKRGPAAERRGLGRPGIAHARSTALRGAGLRRGAPPAGRESNPRVAEHHDGVLARVEPV
jgi:hypothetical protein